MSFAFTRFLLIPELTVQLEIYFSKHNFTVLIRTSKHLSSIFTPMLYNNRFDLIYFDVKDSMTRNFHHIHYLSASAIFIHMFYDLFSGSSPLSLDQHEDEPTSDAFFTSLTRLTCGTKDVDTTHLYQVLPIIRGNPGLAHMYLENVRIHTKQDFIRFLRAVTSLTLLQSLVVCLGENLAELCEFGKSLFFSCPLSIKQLKIQFKEQHLCDSDHSDFEDTLADQNRTLKDINDNMDEETTLFPTRNPLYRM
ncbi:hypothetical protein BG015_007249 [Linnemannia schmuckeri]|uniref:Uncharacterized protein n=1 Tax=Linnemannia schmuckeri TaxID=64567 RepID=A0A9P5RZ49_9FUNG|nr:hypothetical protein BG015_007249 [Linnemannia schmuckeri]